MATILAVSPHLDDAVFSAGGLLARRARESDHVVVATVFTASVPDPRGFALACQLDKGLPAQVDYMALRRAEDASACAILNVEAVWLPFVEAPHRGYHSAEALFGPAHPADAIVPAIDDALRALIERLRPDEIWGPRAIGAHVDHVAVLHALLALDRPLVLWADYPYTARPAPRSSPVALVPEAERRCTVEPPDLARKVEASLAYASQLGFQFGSEGVARASLATQGAVECLCEIDGGRTA